MAHNKKYRKARLPPYVIGKESKRLKEVGMRRGASWKLETLLVDDTLQEAGRALQSPE